MLKPSHRYFPESADIDHVRIILLALKLSSVHRIIKLSVVEVAINQTSKVP